VPDAPAPNKGGRPTNDERFKKIENQVSEIGSAVAGLVEMFQADRQQRAEQEALAATALEEHPRSVVKVAEPPEIGSSRIPKIQVADLPVTADGFVRFRANGRGSQHQHRVRAEQKILVNGEVVYREPKIVEFDNWELYTDDLETIESLITSQDYKDGMIIVLQGDTPVPYRGPTIQTGGRTTGGAPATGNPADSEEISAPLKERTPVG
jgi:hypothetical protein